MAVSIQSESTTPFKLLFRLSYLLDCDHLVAATSEGIDLSEPINSSFVSPGHDH